jgi:alkyldihydroxyacetonephosphate synthase
VSSERSHWGWGLAERFPDRSARAALGAQVAAMLGTGDLDLADPVPIGGVLLGKPRLEPRAGLGELTDDPEARIRHTYGRSYRDLVRGFRGDFSCAPDLVAYPSDEAEVERLLDWASDAAVAVIPFGGGTSVVGGVEPQVGHGFRGVVSLDLARMASLHEVDARSLAARIGAGMLGPAIEAALKPHGLTLRHFPQSFEFSTLGGWIATRAGGHFATLYTHIDDLVESVRMVTPRGLFETRRLPASGAGPSADRLVLGSEGTLGVITDAWVRVRPRPCFRSSVSVRFRDYERAVEATRALSQSGLHPSNARLLDAREAALNFVTGDGSNVLLIAFESADHAVAPLLDRAIELVRGHGGEPEAPVHRTESSEDRAGASESWRRAFVDAPYLQNTMVSLGVIADTFETAVTWDRFETLHGNVIRAVKEAMSAHGKKGVVTCRFTHVYPDGPAPYFTFVVPATPGRELDEWAAIKRAAGDAIEKSGGTITHHHAVGRTHLPWYREERPTLFGEALRAVKLSLDPAGVLNPGCLL